MQEPRGKVEQQIECGSCQWNRFCIQPPTMTKEEVDAQIKGGMSKEGDKGLIEGVLAIMVYGGRDIDCPACPLFIEELRKSPELANEIKKLMQGR